jgi:hypothetical protein
MEFGCLGGRQVVAAFDGGRVSSDGGLLLLRETALRTRMLDRFADCFRDGRHPDLVEHTVQELLAQRILGIACGYEDLNDHDTLREDALLASASGKLDPTGANRLRERDRGRALAGKSTLNRLELTTGGRHRYKKIVCDPEAVERFFVADFLDAHGEPPASIVLDLDATDDPLHGRQEGRFFHGYYRNYCYLPLYIFCGDFLLAAKLRTADRDGADGTVGELTRIVGQIRAAWPEVALTVRADSGFCRDAVMAWCESNRVDYVLGLARNERLEAVLQDSMAQARADHERTGRPARCFKDFRYRTRDSWSRERRVVGKAERLAGKDNPRFVVTSLARKHWEAQRLYERLYCARGEMENRIKEQQLDLFADRTSTATLRANQLRLWLSSVAYCLVNDLRRVGLRGTELAQATCGTIRTRLLKVGAVVTISVRRVRVALSSVFPLQALFERVWHNLLEEYALLE